MIVIRMGGIQPRTAWLNEQGHWTTFRHEAAEFKTVQQAHAAAQLRKVHTPYELFDGDKLIYPPSQYK